MKSKNTLRRGLAVATVVSALAAPTASAAPVEQFVPSTTNGEPSVDYSKSAAGGDYAPAVTGRPESARPGESINYGGINPLTGRPESAPLPQEPDAPAPVRVVQVAADNGFDWSDAGIGAGGLLALAAIASGAVIAIRHRPDPRHKVA